MATIALGYRHNPKPRNTSAPSPFTNWAKGTIATNKGGGFVKQQYKYIWTGSNDSATQIKWGDKNVSYSNISSDGKAGHIYVPNDNYNSSNSSHNVLWCLEWQPYSMSVAGVSFDFIQKQSSTGWGFGKMFLFYRYNGTGNTRVREIQPISGCKTGDNENFRFHRQSTSTYSQISNMQDHSWGNRAHLIAAGNDPGPDYLCVGWGGFFTVMRQANNPRNHGFIYNNFYLIPSGDISTSARWIGGKCNSGNKTDGRYILTQ